MALSYTPRAKTNIGQMTKDTWDTSKLPIYGCLTGIDLPNARVEILPGIVLNRIYVDTIGTTMMAFAPPPTPKSPHPAPWVAVSGEINFKSRTEIELTNINACDGLSPSVAVWLVAAVLRLRISTPIRLAVIGNIPFDMMGERSQEVRAIAFEGAPNQFGPFTAECTEVTEYELSWLRDMLPVSARLYHDERFYRAFSVYDQAQWAPTTEMGTVFVWTAIEILFDLGAERDKTKAICRALSDYVKADPFDRDRAYSIIRELYYKRGQAVHAGRSISSQDVLQTFRFARVAFQNVLIQGRLPMSTKETV